MAQYKGYSRIQIDGDQAYVAGVTGCLDTIEAVADGKKVLDQICGTVHVVTITDTTTGNACGATAWSAFPILLLALKDNVATNFKSELNVAITKAKLGGVTLEHLARQLSVGLSPATYRAVSNVVRPQSSPAKPGATAQQIMADATGQVALAESILKELMDGTRLVQDLPLNWSYEVPRLLRNYLTPGRGAASKVSFNHTKTFHCVDDPAMNQRPPAVGLAHELIHALHNSMGVNMALVKKDSENIEELITTGIPPYNYEELSDNKMRTQWPSHLVLRINY